MAKKTRMVELTDDRVEKLRYSKKGQYIVRDRLLRGFGVKVNARTKTFFVREGEASNPKVIGRFPRYTVEAARKLARERQQEAQDTGHRFYQSGPRTTLQRALDNLIEDYEHGVGTRDGNPAKPATVANYREGLPRYFPGWMDRRLREISAGDLEDRFRTLTKDHGPVAANNAMSMLSKLMKRNRISPNPVRLLKDAGMWNRRPRRDNKRRETVVPENWPKIYNGIMALANDTGRDVLTLCLYTGFRAGEARRLQWDWIDWKAGVIHLPGSVTKNGIDHHMPMSRQVRELLEIRQMNAKAKAERLGPERAQYVFPNRHAEGKTPFMHNTAPSYRRASKNAGVQFTTHTLRFAFATACVGAGVDFPVQQKLLNHTPTTITQHYQNLGVEHLREPAQAVADHIDDLVSVAAEAIEQEAA